MVGAATVLAIAAAVRLAPVVGLEVPRGDGGLFLTFIRDVGQNNLVPPALTSYNGSIQFPYPPLAFELAALAHAGLGLSPMAVLQWVPPLLSIAVVAAFLGFAWGLLEPDRPTALLAAFILTVDPSGYSYLILGGGLTRSLGLLFVVAAWWAAIRLLRERTRGRLLVLGILGGLAQLSHPDGGPATAIGIVFLLAYVGVTRRRVIDVAVAGVVGVLVSSPWWGLAVLRGQLSLIVSAAQTGEGPLYGLVQAVFTLSLRDGLPMLGIGIYLAAAELVLKRDRRLAVLFAWVVALIVLDQRNAYMTVPLVGSILAAIGISGTARRLGRTSGRRLGGLTAALLAGLMLTFQTVVIPGVLPDRTELGQPELAALAAAAKSPAGTRFAVVSGRVGDVDDLSEWFPALTGMVSVGTPQGREWTGTATATLEAHDRLQACVTDGCVNEWATEWRANGIYLGSSAALDGLRSAFRQDAGWRVVYDGPGGTVLVAADPS
jgi:hypothetical protein